MQLVDMHTIQPRWDEKQKIMTRERIDQPRQRAKQTPVEMQGQVAMHQSGKIESGSFYGGRGYFNRVLCAGVGKQGERYVGGT